MESKQVDTNPTKLVRIDAHLHQDMKITAARQGTTLGKLVAQNYAECLGDISQSVEDRG